MTAPTPERKGRGKASEPGYSWYYVRDDFYKKRDAVVRAAVRWAKDFANGEAGCACDERCPCSLHALARAVARLTKTGAAR